MALRAGSMVIAITAVALAATAPIVRAQISTPPPSETSPGAPDSDLPLADFQAFDKFAVAHPKIVSDLSHNPQLVEDQAYLAKHPELRNFLVTHAELRGALIEDPGDFIAPRSGRPPL
jgi:hypothetical protein